MPSEFDLISRYFAKPTPEAVLGPGDDCALLMPSPGMELAVTTDMLVSGVHFLPETDPGQLGWKTLAVNLSDLAAMGAVPRWVLLAGSLPKADESWIAAFADGLFACARRYKVALVGGDTTRGPLNLCITALGEVPSGTALRRDGAQSGDDLWVSGQPGLAALGLAHLQNKMVLTEPFAKRCITALQKPTPRIELGLALRERKLAHAAIDISDGLFADIGHIVERSHLDAEILEAQLPYLPVGADPVSARQAQISGGDDYELAFTASASKRHQIAELAAQLELPLWRIGRMIDAANKAQAVVRFLDEFEQELPVTHTGFDHFGQNKQ